MIDIRDDVSAVVGSCVAAQLASLNVGVGQANPHRADQLAAKNACLNRLEAIGIGPNEVIEMLVTRYVSRLNAQYELTLSGIMSMLSAIKTPDVASEASRSISHLSELDWPDQKAFNILQALQANIRPH